jgi:hypothetical protein
MQQMLCFTLLHCGIATASWKAFYKEIVTRLILAVTSCEDMRKQNEVIGSFLISLYNTTGLNHQLD